jgi:hypothetical protein
MSRLYFKWLKDGLIAANTGRAFTVGGLEAVCSSHRSDKKDSHPRFFASEEEARGKADELRQNRLEAYMRCPGDIVEHARAEQEMGLDYSSRLLLELMQNADDAAAGKAIGYKGLGFKAVLDVSEMVQIKSGHMQIRFDREKSRKALVDANLPADREVPVLRLPFSDGGMVQSSEVEAAYDTIIFLPWKSAGDRKELFSREWESTCTDPTVILFLHALEEVVWQPLHGDRITWQRKRDGEFLNLSVSRGEGKPESSRWRIFRDQMLSAVAIPVDTDGRPRPYLENTNRLRVFFPTEENSPVPMILHGDFDLEQNRKHVRPGGNRADVVCSLARCVRSVLSCVQEDGTFLDLLSTREGKLGLEQEIWKAIQAEVRCLALPQTKAGICSVRLCPQSSTEGFPWYTSKRLAIWQAFKGLLEEHCPNRLRDLYLLSPGVDNSARECVVSAFNPAAHFSMDELCKVALFPVEGSSEPLPAVNGHLFFPPKSGRLQPAPDGITIGFLRRDFSSACERIPDVKLLLERLGIREFEPAAVAEALAKQSLETVESQTLWTYLLAVIAPLLRDSDAVMNWRDKNRENLVSRIKVPCRDGLWRPAIQVYAGQEWTGDDFLERTYVARNDRNFLVQPDRDLAARELMERLGRWLCVGWSPKVLPIVNFEDHAGTREGIRWVNGFFPISPRPALWPEYWIEKDEAYTNTARSARLRQDWTLDGDVQVLRTDGAFACISREWRNYERYLSATIYRSSNMREDYDNESHASDSYLSYLFKHASWIPSEEDKISRSAAEVFQKGNEVHYNLTHWVFAPALEVSDGIQKGVGIRSFWREVGGKDWMRWLAKAAESDKIKEPSIRALISKLYAQVLVKASGSLKWNGPIWSVQKRADNTEEWRLETSRKNVFYVDRPDLARLRLQALRMFPVELGWSGNKQKVAEFFAIPALSEHLRGKAEFKNGAPETTLIQKIRDRLQDRADCLAAYLRVKGKDSSAAAQQWKELGFHVGSDLRVSFVLDGRLLELQPRPTFFQPKSSGTSSALWLDTEENFTDKAQPKDIVWEEVGAALCYSAGLALEDGTVFAALLGCGEDSLKRKLLNLGVTEADIKTAMPKSQSTEITQTPFQPSPLQAESSASPLMSESLEAAQAESAKKSEPTLDDIAPNGDLIEKLRRASQQLANEPPQQIETTVTRTIQNDTEMIKGLKALCEFRCQFPGCGKQIRKRDGGFYIEVAHVKARASGGTSVLGNLVVLCPNHHKEFDYGELEIIEQTEGLLYGRLDGVEFRISLPKPA